MAPSNAFIPTPDKGWHENATKLLTQEGLGKPLAFDVGAKKVAKKYVTESWPQQLEDQMAWSGCEYVDGARYTYHLGAAEVDEIEGALAHFKGLGLGVESIDKSTFPLPTLAPRLFRVSEELHSGRGFANIRGLNVEAYCEEDHALLFLGISSHIANKRGLQDEDGYVFDRYADILALQTRQLAATGGEHVLASSWMIYNELAATRPDLLELLARPDWVYDSPGQAHHGVSRPLLFFEDGKIILNFVRYQLTGLLMTPRSAGLPDLTASQLEALDALESLALKHELVVDMQPGDMTYVNNWSVCHSRRPFENDGNHVRHLVRMWLKSENMAWKLPEALQDGNGTIYDNKELPRLWNISPQPRIRFSFWNKLAP